MVDPYCCNNDWDEKCQQLYWHCSGDTPLDVRDLMRNHNVALYPVPVDSYLNILAKGPVGIKVHDITGKLVIKVKPNQTHEGVNRLDMSLLKAGVYNFTINYKGRISTKNN